MQTETKLQEKDSVAKVPQAVPYEILIFLKQTDPR